MVDLSSPVFKITASGYVPTANAQLDCHGITVAIRLSSGCNVKIICHHIGSAFEAVIMLPCVICVFGEEDGCINCIMVPVPKFKEQRCSPIVELTFPLLPSGVRIEAALALTCYTTD